MKKYYDFDEQAGGRVLLEQIIDKCYKPFEISTEPESLHIGDSIWQSADKKLRR
jgi:hypothetical protein